MLNDIERNGDSLFQTIINIYPDHGLNGEDLYITNKDYQCGFFENHAELAPVNNELNRKLYPKLVQYGDYLVKPHIAQKIYLYKNKK